jgi:pyruvate,water dikinase
LKHRTGGGAQAQAQSGRRMRESANYWFKRAIGRLDIRSIRPRITSRRAEFRMMYDRFREILALNDSTLELIAEIEDLLSSGKKFSLGAIARRIRKAAMDVFIMVKDLNLIAGNRHKELYESLRGLNQLLEQELAPVKEATLGRYVASLQEIRSSDALLVGSKMANLGEVAAECGFATPDGFAISTEAFLRFMTDGQLWERCERLDAALESDDSRGLLEACREVQQALAATAVPHDIAELIHEAFKKHFDDPATHIAVRSSAVGEDTAVSSHAGLYRTELDVDAAHLLDAYRTVLASMFSPTAVSYRFQRGLTISDSLMAVGCIRMVEPRCAGIVFSRLPDEPEADAIMISAMAGSAQEMATGNQSAETWVVTAGRTAGVGGSLLSQAEVASLIGTARKIESHFGTPQDIEWAIDHRGVLMILQARPIAALAVVSEVFEGVVSDQPPLLEGGFVACPGVGSGPAVLKYSDEDFSDFPEGAVLVARHSTPGFAQIMGRCAAIVTDIGSPTGHMSSLSREFAVPTIVGLDGATRAISNGQQITVDAWACRLFNGIINAQSGSPRIRSIGDSPAMERLRHIARVVTPLSLTDPASPEFHPENCRSLHDVTRYVHEKAFEVMFHYGEIADLTDNSAVRLQAKLPIKVEIFDVGGGISADLVPKSAVRPEHIGSVPMRAFLEGLLDPRIRWDLPRPVSMRGFFSVLGESVAGLPADATEIGRVSYAIISDRYMNFSTKAGYHFSTVDTYCGRSINKNYIHFRFFGGAADEARRRRRVQFISAVVTALDFKVQVRGDTLFAALDKYGSEDIQSRLVSLGRLTLCARQLDMLMDNDSSPYIFARAFLACDWQRF